jgi:hypothetical protein
MSKETKVIKYPSGVVLTRVFDNTYESWIIDNKALSVAEFTLDLSNCENVFFDVDSSRTSMNVFVNSQETGELRITKTLPWKFSASFGLNETPLSLEDQRVALEHEKGATDNKVEESENIFKTIPYEVLSTKEIGQRMRELKQTNFIDPHFSPRDISLYNVLEDKYPYQFIVQWRRPHEFMDHPVVFEEDIDPNDIKQGQLGDCWFLSALSSLAERPGLVRRLFITQEYNPDGVYQIRLCKNGEWVTVTVDDYIPCRYNGGPMFSRGAGNELWVMLIEKAYAKLHGNYQALSSGFTKHAMVDLTGCPTEHIKFPDHGEDYEDIEDEADEIFDRLREADEEGYLISTETSGVDTITEGGGPAKGGGLVSGHAYSIIQVKETEDGHKLLNIRNPWGKFEWNGAWSDNAEEWTEDLIDELQVNFDANDGAFWMCLEDFIKKFEAATFSKIENYNEARLKGKFLRCKAKEGKQEYVTSKFYYTFEVEEEMDVTIGIHQDDERIVGGHLRQNMDVGFVLLRLEGDDDEVESEFHDYGEFTRERELFKTMSLEEGKYAVVPLTSGAIMQKTLKAKTQKIPPKFSFEDTVWPHPYFSSTINDIFRKLDLAVNGQLSADELNQFGKIIGEPLFMDITESDFSKDMFRNISCDKFGVSLLGFKQLFFRSFTNPEISDVLHKLGYDDALNSSKSRAFMISVQATEPLSVDINDILDSDYHRTAWEKLLEHIKDDEGMNDQCTEEDDFSLFAYTHPGSYSASYMVTNESEEHLKVRLDVNDSASCLYVPSDGIIEKTVAPGQSSYLGSIACDPDAQSYVFSYRVEAEEVEVSEKDEESNESNGSNDENSRSDSE